MPLPIRVGLYPSHDTTTPIHVEALGMLGGVLVVSRSATLSFVPGQQKLLALPLLAVCRSVKRSAANTTCKASGACEPDTVVSTALPSYTPNQPVSGQDGGSRGSDVGADGVSGANPDGSSDVQSDATRDARWPT